MQLSPLKALIRQKGEALWEICLDNKIFYGQLHTTAEIFIGLQIWHG
jgi:hypothetical protein